MQKKCPPGERKRAAMTIDSKCKRIVSPLIFRKIPEHPPVGGENICFRYKPYVFPVFYHRDIKMSAIVNLAGYIFHGIVRIHGICGDMHQVPDQGGFMQFRFEHDVADVIQVYNAF